MLRLRPKRVIRTKLPNPVERAAADKAFRDAVLADDGTIELSANSQSLITSFITDEMVRRIAQSMRVSIGLTGSGGGGGSAAPSSGGGMAFGGMEDAVYIDSSRQEHIVARATANHIHVTASPPSGPVLGTEDFEEPNTRLIQLNDISGGETIIWNGEHRRVLTAQHNLDINRTTLELVLSDTNATAVTVSYASETYITQVMPDEQEDESFPIPASELQTGDILILPTHQHVVRNVSLRLNTDEVQVTYEDRHGNICNTLFARDMLVNIQRHVVAPDNVSQQANVRHLLVTPDEVEIGDAILLADRLCTVTELEVQQDGTIRITFTNGEEQASSVYYLGEYLTVMRTINDPVGFDDVAQSVTQLTPISVRGEDLVVGDIVTIAGRQRRITEVEQIVPTMIEIAYEDDHGTVRFQDYNLEEMVPILR